VILVDPRLGSGDLAKYFRFWGTPHAVTHLDFGDVNFTGKGPHGPCQIAVEIKTAAEMIECMQPGRFRGRQLPGLVKYFRMAWLCVEGFYSFDRETGLLTCRRGDDTVPLDWGGKNYMYRDLDHFIMTIETKAGLRTRRTYSRVETAKFIADLYSWWTVKEWDEHRSHLAFNDEDVDEELFVQPTLKRIWAKGLPGIAWEKSKAVAARFRNAREMANASVEEWEEIDGIGEILSRKIVKAIEEE
jgi:ERCC4-type nuclease